MADSPMPSTPVAPRRWALVLMGALAIGIGLLPYLLWIDRLRYLWVVVPGSAVLAYFALRGFETEAAMQPALPEWLLGAWSAVAFPATGGLVGMLFYGMGFGLQRTLAWALGAWGWAPLGDASAWGYWGSIWFVAVAALVATTLRLPEVARQLYPREAWSRSAFHPLLARSRWLALGAVAGVLALAVMTGWLDRHGVALPLLAALLIFYTSFPLAQLGKVTPDRARAQVVAAIERLLGQQGYRVVRQPRTGRADTDPLLQSIDLLARGPVQAFAVEVQSVMGAAAVEWQAANALRTAATVLGEEPGPGELPALPVLPLLVLVGGRMAQSLEAFSQRERVPVVQLPDVEVDGDPADPERLAQLLRAAGLALPAAAAQVEPP